MLDLIDKRTDSISFTSINPAYNSYHPLLIHADNIKGYDAITVLGALYKKKRKLIILN